MIDLFSGHPHMSKRARALEVFSGSSLYRKVVGLPADGGLGGEEVDARVSEIVRLFG